MNSEESKVASLFDSNEYIYNVHKTPVIKFPQLNK